MTGGALHRTVVLLVWLSTAAIAAQAVLAGQFISGATDLVMAHLVVGSVLEQMSWILLVVGLCDGALRRASRHLWLATALFAVAVTVQAILGHVGMSGSIAVHVPLGVALFAWSITLSLRLPGAIPAGPLWPAHACPEVARTPPARHTHRSTRTWLSW